MISIIIPVFNSESYLNKCLDSLVNQTYENIEILCINDGSSDSSLAILNEFSKKDSRIKVFSQSNKGQSSARNLGLKEAKGDYILFIDSDDWVDLDFCEKIICTIKENDCDISIATIIRTGKKSSKIRLKFDKVETFETFEEKLAICNMPKCCYTCAKLYKKELFKDLSFKEGVYFEDVILLPQLIKKAKKITTTPKTTYYYRVNPNSTVKSIPNKKKQQDSYNAKKFYNNFMLENNIQLTKKERTIVKSIKFLGKIPFLKTKEFENQEITYLFGFLPIFKKTIKTPIIKENTFIVWEPCSKSHSEVVPGYCKYLLDLGYHVSVLVTPDRLKEGLFSKFNHENLSLNKLKQKEIKSFFKNNPINNIKGVMVTTVGKICDCVHYKQSYDAFNSEIDRKKLLFVEHESLAAIDNNTWEENLITLRKLNYKNQNSVVVNPHYFGNLKFNPKNEITNFISIGALTANKLDTNIIVDAAKQLHNDGITNFKITVIGKGNIKNIPTEIRKYFDIKGRLPFKKMYEELEQADFMLTSYSQNNPKHQRYNTTGTSGNFQLVYGFLKPCVILEEYAPINDFNNSNSILYSKDEDYKLALLKGIKQTKEEYQTMQEELKKTAQNIYQNSLNNLKNLIENNTGFTKD